MRNGCSTLQRMEDFSCSILEDLFAQLTEVVATMDSIDFSEVFIDGTKIEANANRYTFVWKKTVEKNFEKLRTKIEGLREDAETLLGTDLSGTDIEHISCQLKEYMESENIEEVHGSGKRKTAAQRLREKSCVANARQETNELQGIRQKKPHLPDAL